MPPLSLLIALAALVVAVPAITWAVLVGPQKGQKKVISNLQKGLSVPTPTEQATYDQPATGALAGFARRTATPGSVARIERFLARAGRPPAWPVDRVLAAKVALSGVAGILSVLVVISHPTLMFIGLAVGLTILGFFVPDILLHSRGQERSQQIGLELPDTLDQMTIAVEAGLGFDSAMARAGRNGKGPLAEELIRTLQDIQVGHSRREAYLSLGERTNVPDLRKFIRAIVQADTYGVAVADVLRTQAAEMRMKRRARAEEKAMKIPVKVIFPLMLCILPVLFIVLLGPAVMGIVAAFS